MNNVSDSEYVIAKPFYRGGWVNSKGRRVGEHLLIHYKVKDVDSVPAMLAPGEYVLTKKMQQKVRMAFDRAGMKRLKGM
jgi:hypothetical protein